MMVPFDVNNYSADTQDTSAYTNAPHPTFTMSFVILYFLLTLTFKVLLPSTIFEIIPCRHSRIKGSRASALQSRAEKADSTYSPLMTERPAPALP